MFARFWVWIRAVRRSSFFVCGIFFVCGSAVFVSADFFFVLIVVYWTVYESMSMVMWTLR